jgi:tetratricopeptide (TPR) repeat protein
LTDLYSILEIAHNASAEEIKAAYKRLAKQYHPDKNPDNPSAEELFKQISKAYQVLSNPSLRERYDQWSKRAQEEEPVQDRRYRNRSYTYTPPPPEPPSGPKMKYWEIALWLGGSILAFSLILWVSIWQLSKYDARKKYEEGHSAYFSEGALDKAAHLLAGAIARNDEFADAYFLLGEVLLEKQQYKSAIVNYEKAISLQLPSEGKHYFNKAMAHNALGQQIEAYEALRSGFMLDSAQWQAQLLAGNIAVFHLHKYDQAKQHFKNVLKVNPNHSMALLGLGIALHHQNEYALSNKCLLQVSMQEPSEARTYYYMAVNQLHAGDTASACGLLEGALSLGLIEAKVIQMSVCRPPARK